MISNNSVGFKNIMVEYKFFKNERDNEVVLFKHDGRLFLLHNWRVFDDIFDIEKITNSFGIETIGGFNDLIADESFINITPPTFIERILKYIDCLYVGNTLSMIFKNTQTDELCLACVSINGLALSSVKNQTPDICLAAIKENPLALKYVKNQTDAICLAAVKQNGYALDYVENQTETICLAAVKQNGYSLRYVKNQTPEICLAAVRNDGWSIQYSITPSYVIYLNAIGNNLDVFNYVRSHLVALYLDLVVHDKLYLGDIKYTKQSKHSKALKIITGDVGI